MFFNKKTELSKSDNAFLEFFILHTKKVYGSQKEALSILKNAIALYFNYNPTYENEMGPKNKGLIPSVISRIMDVISTRLNDSEMRIDRDLLKGTFKSMLIASQIANEYLHEFTTHNKNAEFGKENAEFHIDTKDLTFRFTDEDDPIFYLEWGVAGFLADKDYYDADGILTVISNLADFTILKAKEHHFDIDKTKLLLDFKNTEAGKPHSDIIDLIISYTKLTKPTHHDFRNEDELIKAIPKIFTEEKDVKRIFQEFTERYLVVEGPTKDTPPLILNLAKIISERAKEFNVKESDLINIYKSEILPDFLQKSERKPR